MKIFKRLKKANKLLNAGPILRRYFAMNSFDGALAGLGIVFGNFLAKVTQAEIVILTLVSTSIALLVAGMSSAYFTEKAERLQEIKKMEKRLLHSLKKSDHKRAADLVNIESTLVNGLSPFIMLVLMTVPFFLAAQGTIDIAQAFSISLGIGLLAIFIIGFYLGKVSKQNTWILGLKMLLAGILSLLISFLVAGYSF